MSERYTLPVLPLRDTVVYPGVAVPISAGRPGTVEAVQEALDGDRRLFAVAQTENVDDPSPDVLYRVGTVVRIIQTHRVRGGVQLLVALVSRDVLSLSGSATGALLITGSLTAVVLTPRWGAIIDRTGAKRATVLALLLSMAGAVVLSQAKTTLALVMVWAVVGGLVQCIGTGFQTLAATGVPGNRAGGVSFVLSHRFLGHAIGPLIWVPVFERNVSLSYLGAALVGVLSIVFVYAAQHDTLTSDKHR